VLDHLGSITSLEDISSRIYAFLDVHYHASPHAGLMGRAPGLVYAPGQREIDVLSEARLREALTLRQRRRVRRDTTVSLRGQLFELDHGYLAGRTVTVAYCLLDEPLAPVVELEGQRIPLRLVDPVHNAHVKRPQRRATTSDASPARQPVAFDPGGALLLKSARDAASAADADDVDGEEDLDAIF
jgi:putative transposase